MLLKEHARDVVYRMHRDPSFNTTFAAYIRSLPTPDELFTPELWTKKHLSMLQNPELEALAEYVIGGTEDVYHGSFTEAVYEPMSQLMGNDTVVSLGEFKYVSALLSSRYFGIGMEEYDEHGAEKVAYVLAPAVDLVNHANSDAPDLNAYHTVYQGTLKLRALRPIAKGEEIRIDYQPGVVHRNDMSLLVYGFVQERDPPLMCSIDLPTYDSDEPYAQTPATDADFYGPGGEWNTEEEYVRLEVLLKGAETTEDEDRVLLESGAVSDWRERMLVRFRMMRKEAIRRSMNAIAQELGFDEGDVKDEL